MEYAMVEDGIVVNLIWLDPYNAADFPAAVPLDGRPVRIGDRCAGGIFTRDGNPVRSPSEEAQALRAALAVLGIQEEAEHGQAI